MSEEKKTPKTTGIAFTPENYVFLQASVAAEPEGERSLSKIINKMTEKIRTGQLVDAQAITEGNAEFNCLFNLSTIDGELKQSCPVKLNCPEKFNGPENVGSLLAACAKCMRRYEHKKLVDVRLNYPKAFERHEEPTKTPKEEQFIPACDTCGLEFHLERYTKFLTPALAMRNAMLEHVKKEHERNHLTAEEWPAAMVARCQK